MNMTLIVEKAKNAYKSSTIWFNAAMAVAYPLIELAQNNVPVLQTLLPASYVLAITVIGNILLRFKTRVPLEEK